MIKLEQLPRGRVYRLQSRNLECGVWNGKDGFVGIRTKFGGRFLDMEIHWDFNVDVTQNVYNRTWWEERVEAVSMAAATVWREFLAQPVLAVPM